MLVAFLRRDESYSSTTFLPVLAFTQRCTNPIEPLILGLVALDNNNNNNNNSYQSNSSNSSMCIPTPTPLPPLSSSSSNSSPRSSAIPDPRLDIISTLLQYYCCSVDGTKLSTSHCTNKLLLALMSFQNSDRRLSIQNNNKEEGGTLDDDKGIIDSTTITALDRLRVSVASTAGLASRSTRTLGSGDFPMVRWLPSGFKFFVGLNARLPYLSALDLISSTRPELLDLLMDAAGTYGGTSLPHRQSQIAKQYSACALLMLGLSMSTSSSRSSGRSSSSSSSSNSRSSSRRSNSNSM